MNTAPQAPETECTCLNRYDRCQRCRAAAAVPKPTVEVAAPKPPKPRRPAPAKSLPPDAVWITPKDAAALLSVGVRTFWRLAALPDFSTPFRLSAKLIRWNKADLLAWAERRAAG